MNKKRTILQMKNKNKMNTKSKTTDDGYSTLCSTLKPDKLSLHPDKYLDGNQWYTNEVLFFFV